MITLAFFVLSVAAYVRKQWFAFGFLLCALCFAASARADVPPVAETHGSGPRWVILLVIIYGAYACARSRTL